MGTLAAALGYQAPPKEKRANVASAMSDTDPSAVLRSVLSSHKGFSSVYGPGSVDVIVADPARMKIAGQYNAGAGLEFWPSSESGTSQFPRPANTNGKTVLEIYNPDLAKNPNALRTAIYGDLMHGMVNNPYWKLMRDAFMHSFTPQELARQKQHKTWWDDVNGAEGSFGPEYDAYIRGWLANEGEGRKGQTESKNTMYSPRQLKILEDMKRFLETGVVPR